MNKVYQILTINKTYGFIDVIPSLYCYTTKEKALESVEFQIRTFTDRDENATYCGCLNSLDQIMNLFTLRENLPTIDIYILVMEVK